MAPGSQIPLKAEYIDADQTVSNFACKSAADHTKTIKYEIV